MSSTNVSESNPMGFNYMGVMPCSCQCWHGPKAPKISTLTNSIRASVAPYAVNTTNSLSASGPPCHHCKLKKDQEQLQKIQQQLNELNSSQHQQMTTRCRCQINQSSSGPLLTFPVPPPPLPPAPPSFLPTTTQTPNLLMPPPPPANITTNNQMYFVPFGIPGFVPGPTQTIPRNPLPAANLCPHHAPKLPPSIKASYVRPINSTDHNRTVLSQQLTDDNADDENVYYCNNSILKTSPEKVASVNIEEPRCWT